MAILDFSTPATLAARKTYLTLKLIDAETKVLCDQLANVSILEPTERVELAIEILKLQTERAEVVSEFKKDLQ